MAETTTFIAECSEDENDMVIRESFKLKNAVENVAGKIDGLWINVEMKIYKVIVTKGV